MLSQQPPVQDDSLVRLTQLLLSAVRHGALRHPGHSVLADREVYREAARLFVFVRDVVHRNFILSRRFDSASIRRVVGVVVHVPGVGVVDGNPHLEAGAHPEVVGEDDGMANLPGRVIPGSAMVNATLDYPVLVHVEADLAVAGDVPLPGLRVALAFEYVGGLVGVQPLGVGGIKGVLHTLHPVAGQYGDADIPQDVGFNKHVPAGQQGRRLGPKIGPNQPAHFLHRIGRHSHPVREGALRRLRRHFQAPSLFVHQPAVVGAPQPRFFGDAVKQVDAPVRAGLVNKSKGAAAVFVQHQVLAQDAHRLGGGIL